MSGLKGHSYKESLIELKLPSLSKRCREIDMVQTYKAVTDKNTDQFLVRAEARRETRATVGTANLMKKRNNHEYRNNFFSLRVVREWNSLPNAEKEAKTAKIFKLLYKRHCVGTVAPTGEDQTR